MKHQPFENTFFVNEALVSLPAALDDKNPPTTYFVFKRLFDVVMCLVLLPVMLVSCLALFVLNPRKNQGPVFFIQTRMGRDCKPFQAIKFRSMTETDKIERGVNDPLETDRITPLGHFLRRSRLDEIPQILNVLKGEMSLIGPRPDYFEHAKELVDIVPGYKARHNVVPGISGYAQTEIGYADSFDMIRKKVIADTYYISNRSVALETWIVWRTLQTIVRREGA